MSIRLTLGLVAVFLAGCVGTGPTSNEEATQALEKTLVWGQFVSYKDVARYPGDVVCGQYKDMDPWTGDGDYKHFAVVRGTAYKDLSVLDLAIFCTTDPADVLQAELGIGPFSRENSALQKVHADLSEIVEALESFQYDNGFYPTTAEGLGLITTPKGSGRQLTMPDGGYISPIPVDPWGRPYQYKSQSFAGVKGKFDLWTLGADNAEGGTGPDADIRRDYLKYLDHVSSLK